MIAVHVFHQLFTLKHVYSLSMSKTTDDTYLSDVVIEAMYFSFENDNWDGAQVEQWMK